jgi:hypothetical protein
MVEPEPDLFVDQNAETQQLRFPFGGSGQGETDGQTSLVMPSRDAERWEPGQ